MMREWGCGRGRPQPGANSVSGVRFFANSGIHVRVPQSDDRFTSRPFLSDRIWVRSKRLSPSSDGASTFHFAPIPHRSQQEGRTPRAHHSLVALSNVRPADRNPNICHRARFAVHRFSGDKGGLTFPYGAADAFRKGMESAPRSLGRGGTRSSLCRPPPSARGDIPPGLRLIATARAFGSAADDPARRGRG